MPESRAEARAAFLAAVGQSGATLDPLPVDASRRRYFRVVGSWPAVLLMDAPPPDEDILPFVRIARHLTGLGLSAPAILEYDAALGFALIEDFGHETYSRLLDRGDDPEPYFAAAADALTVLHTHPAGAAVDAPQFTHDKMLEEVSELPDWYGLAVNSAKLPASARDGFIETWRAALERMPAPETGLVLLDFHVDNLMLLPGRAGAAACGLLDFQDARIGPKPYDLLCLLRNERRGIDQALSDRLYARYLERAPPIDTEGFAIWYRLLAAQRYTKVVGRFARLTLRDGRDGYVRYLPRVLRLLAEAMDAEPLLQPVRAQLDAMLPDWRRSPSDDPVQLRRRLGAAIGNERISD